jgi:hypothetical protein
MSPLAPPIIADERNSWESTFLDVRPYRAALRRLMLSWA